MEDKLEQLKEVGIEITNNKDYKYTIDKDKVVIHLHYKNTTMNVYIDLDDMEKVFNFPYKWFIKKSRRRYRVWATVYDGFENGILKNHTEVLHRFLINAKDDEHIDHIDHNPLNNCKSNLRRTINKYNMQNRGGKNINNTSGYRNVSWDKRAERWIVQLQVNGKNKVLGMFDYVHEAGKFAEEMRKKYYGEFAGKG